MKTTRNSTEMVQKLTDLEIPGLFDGQLDLFTTESLHVEETMYFNPSQAVSDLAQHESTSVVAADFGGDKGIVRTFTIVDGKPVVSPDYNDDIQGDDGAGYYSTIKRAAAYATAQGLQLGISWGGPLQGSELVYHPKATRFYEDVVQYADRDLAKISPSISAVINDGPAGLIAGAVEAYRRYDADTVLFIINGGGIGMAVLQDNIVYATEAGHVEGHELLNTYEQVDDCGVFDATYTCMERLGANKAGIEAQWQARTGNYMRAKDIEDEYKRGDKLAKDLYDHSALVIAHVIEGTANVFDINIADSNVAIVCHGGAFKFPHYGERIQQMLSQYVKGQVNLLMTKEFTGEDSNACLDGAAITAVTA